MHSVTAPPGETAAERTAAFLAHYGGQTMQYLYPEPGQQWNLATEDVRQLLREHQELRRRVQLAQNYAVSALIDKLLELNLTIDLEDLPNFLDKTQH